MAHKLEVLTSRDGAVVASPRVAVDASMSMAFKLPANFVRPTRRAAAHAPPPAAVAGAKKKAFDAQLAANWLTANKETVSGAAVAGKRGSGDDGGEDVDFSWEDRDFSAPLASQAGKTLEHTWEEEDMEMDTTAVSSAMAALEISAWEEQDAPDLPDEFPVLVVNLTRLQRDHFPRNVAGGPPLPPTEEEMRQVFAMVKQTLHRHFAHMVEVLFEQKSCFHCTYGTSRSMLDNLHAAYPEDIFALIDYPTEIQGIPLHEYLFQLSRPSRWKSIEYLKECLRRCSRDIKWKLDVAMELEVLAAQEHDHYVNKQTELGVEIDDLTRLRDSFKAKLDKTSGPTADGKKPGTSSAHYLLLRKLEDIETRLMTLLNTYLEEPELRESECYGMFEMAGDGSPSAGKMNVLDMVVAMIFSRLPRDFSQQLTSEEHFQMLFDHHIHIRRLWKKDFGRLPPRTNAAAYTSDGADDVDNEAAVSPDEEHDVPPLMSESEDEGAQGYGYDDLESYEKVEMEQSLSGGGSNGSEEWEAVYAEDNESSMGMKEDDIDDEDARSVISDAGYGGDYDSDESEDDLPAAAAQTNTEVASIRRSGTAKKPSRRTRAVRQAKPLVVEEKTEIEESKPKKKKEKKAKTSKKSTSKEAKAKKSKGDDEEVPFQPFACTGALNFLRIAKENEMF
uniref:Uncharacterized protein n=1 Tax=Globisporangium ultimum (strain ATCC 200006 / CBS 805.95 / DAOM BR144) TaxID=431595 RepID=K3WTU9_GLOUD